MGRFRSSNKISIVTLIAGKMFSNLCLVRYIDKVKTPSIRGCY